MGWIGSKKKVQKPLKGISIASFYGCYILRPSWNLGYKEHPTRDHYIEDIAEVCGASVADFQGKFKCCGFPILSINKKNSFAMANRHLNDAKNQGADFMVTPCPLCHLNLDANQPDLIREAKGPIDLPVLHLPQFVGLALGIDPVKLGLNKNIVDTQKILNLVPVP